MVDEEGEEGKEADESSIVDPASLEAAVRVVGFDRCERALIATHTKAPNAPQGLWGAPGVSVPIT